jgi:signal transduction histidine kinase
MRFWRRLHTRLFASYLLVIAIGSMAILVVSSLLTRSLFQTHLGGMQRGMGGLRSATVAQLRSALADSLNIALLIGLGAALLAAGTAALVLGRRLLRPIEDIRSAAGRIASGDYKQEIAVPDVEELAGLADDVNTLGRTLAATEQRRTRLVGEVAHELRSPLTTIRASMEGIIDGVIEPTGDVFATVADEAGRLERLADDLTLLSQAEEGAMPLSPISCDLADVAARAANRLGPQFEDAGVTLTIRGDDHLPVRGDPDRLAQVFVNLLGNALTHTPEGGRVTIHRRSMSRGAAVDIVDTGRGIAAADLPHLFERFFRIADPSHPAGRGIGLTIARSVARAHGGDITAASDGLGRGATFTVIIPSSAQTTG